VDICVYRLAGCLAGPLEDHLADRLKALAKGKGSWARAFSARPSSALDLSLITILG
jgi:hypothetical protein